MVAVPASVASSQNFTLPKIPELLLPNFLDLLLPPTNKPTDVKPTRNVDDGPSNPLMDALKDSANRTRTLNNAPTFSATGSATLDAFEEINHESGVGLASLLCKAWNEDPELTLRIIWNLRSIPDGKGEKEAFYKAFGWLYKHHPRTAISNLHLLIDPVCVRSKRRGAKAHGYWKDLLNILALETVDELVDFGGRPEFLHHPRQPFTYSSARNATKPANEREARIEAAKKANERGKVTAQELRAKVASDGHAKLVRKLESPKYRALYIAVARLFADRLSKDLALLTEADNLPPDVDRIAFLKQLSLAGKWAPTPHLSHDRVTNISTAIAFIIRDSQIFPFPASLDDANLSQRERTAILRSVYQRWVLTPLRRVLAVPEPLMSSGRWRDIKYHRIPSVCMKANKDRFFEHDESGFEKYLIRVEEGRSKISGATLMPHQLVAEALSLAARSEVDSASNKGSALYEVKKRLAEMRVRVVEGQWKSLVQDLRDAGTIENSIAVCDVSGSMGSLHDKLEKDRPQPIFPAVALSLILAQLAKPPFSNGFITFSANPEFVVLDPTMSLADTLHVMQTSRWGMNTDFNAVFLELILPLAIKNKIKQEDMIKRLFIFSDMQFDSASGNNGYTPSADAHSRWETNHAAIERQYKEHGYEVPQIVYWDLAAYGTMPVTAEKKGAALMNGFSAAMLKVFMGEADDEWEDVKKDGSSQSVSVEQSFDPVSVMKKAVEMKSFEALVVVD